MRRLFVTLLSLLVVVPAAAAATRQTGDGVLELKAVYGTVAIGKETQLARGLAWGQMDKGRLVVVDPLPGDGQAFVSGCEYRTSSVNDAGATVTVCNGTNLHFRITGGKYRLFFKGSGIDLTAIGVGTAYLNGDADALDPGEYALDSGNWIPVPVFLIPQKSKIVPFGTQPTLSSSQTP